MANLFNIHTRLTINLKIYIGLGTIVMVFVILAIIVSSLIQDTVTKQKKYIKHAEYTSNINNQFNGHLQWYNELTDFVLNPDNKQAVESDPKKCKLSLWLSDTLKASIETDLPESELYFQRLKIAHNDLHNSAQKVQTLLQYAQKNEALETFEKETNPLFAKTKQEFTNTLQYFEETKNEANQLQEIIYARQIMIVGMLIAVGLAVIMAFLFSKEIILPLKQIKTAAKRMADGNFTQTLPLQRNDEFGEVFEALNTMTVQLQNVIEGIKDNINNFVSSGNALSRNAKNISQLTIQQVATSESLAASLHEMTANIEQTAHNSWQTEDMAFAVVTNAKSGSADMKTAAEMLKNIAHKTEVISHIAFQTNILSLNAAIEAARAGDSGKSFAVVAGEVGDLAEKSQISAEEIEDLSSNSTEIADKAVELLDTLIEDINKTYEYISGISEAAKLQQKNSEVIGVSITEMNRITQKNAISAAELAKNADKLADSTNILREMIAYFKVS